MCFGDGKVAKRNMKSMYWFKKLIEYLTNNQAEIDEFRERMGDNYGK